MTTLAPRSDLDPAVATPPREPVAAVPIRRGPVAFAAIGLLVGSSGPSVTIGVHLLDQPLSFENWAFLYPMVAVGVVGFALLWQRLRALPWRQWPWPIWPLAALQLWALLSVGWSVTPELTTTRAPIAAGVAAFAVWLGMTLRFREFIVAVGAFNVAAVASSVVLLIGWPDLSRNINDEWHGIFASANSLGPVAMVGILVSVALALEYRTAAAVAGATVLAVANLVLLAGTNSVTALAALIAAGLVLPAVALTRSLSRRGVPPRPVALGAAVVGAGTAILVMFNVSRIAEALGQDPTLVRRTLIWSDMRTFIGERPLQGYGYWAFWDNLDYSWRSFRDVGNWYGSAHNSVLETALGLGLVGAALLGAVVLAVLAGAARFVWRDRTWRSWWWSALATAVLVEHSTESFVLWHSYMWVLLVAAAFLPVGWARSAEPRDSTPRRYADR